MTASITSFPFRPADRAARGQTAAGIPGSITVVVPTYREAENLPHLIDQVASVREAHGLAIDLLIVDDNSRDGSVEIVASRPEPWVEILVRTADRGLSAAVLDGMRRARGEVLVCMDADLSHPPDALPRMLAKLEAGADFVIGSRYVDGGSTADDWGFLRWLNSRVATLLARPLTTVADPMAGFFALRRSTFEQGHELAPVGYKIGLELMVKCRCERVVEVPIQFEDRRFGESKLTLAQQLLYLRHLRRLYIFKYGAWTQLTQFLLVGGLGTVVNLVVLTNLVARNVPTQAGCRGVDLRRDVLQFRAQSSFQLLAGPRRLLAPAVLRLRRGILRRRPDQLWDDVVRPRTRDGDAAAGCCSSWHRGRDDVQFRGQSLSRLPHLTHPAQDVGCPPERRAATSL